MEKARVKEEHRNRYVLETSKGDISATVRGKLHFEHSLGESVVPKVGDYVKYEMVDDENAVIIEILPRGNSFVRRAADDRTPQVIVANVDVGVVVQGLDGDFNVKRLERYLKLIEGSGAKPVIVLNKLDVVEDTSSYKKQVKEVASDVPLYVISAKSGAGMEELLEVFKSGETSVFLGSSGAGKSTITNFLLNTEVQATKSVRENDSRGRHATTSRQLFTLPNGAFIIDTPGMRELSLVEGEEDTEVFSDIEEMAQKCKFRDCDHEKSSGCAILAAIGSGEIEKKHFENYLKLEREGEFEKSKVDVSGARTAKAKDKLLAKRIKRVKEGKRFERRG